MSTPIRASQATLIEIRQALQVIELNRRTAPLHNFDAGDNPDGDNDESEGYSVQSWWYNSSAEELFLCTDATTGNAQWTNLTSAGILGSAFKTITAPDANSVVADGAADTLTITESGGIAITVAGTAENDTLNFDGAASVHNHAASDITSGLLVLERGGTEADLSGTGGSSQVLQQASAGAAVTVGQLTHSDLNVLGFFNGTFLETFDALATSDGATVTMTLTNAVSGNLTMVFSDGETTFDLSGSDGIIALTAGGDNSPTLNYVYILQSDKILTVSTSGWPTAEHIRIGVFFVPSVGYVQTRGVFITHNMNDHAADQTTNLGHLSHITERIRAQSAIYKTGADLTITLSGGGAVVDVDITAGVVYQMHKHATPALNTATGDVVLVVNQNGAAYDSVTDLENLTNDSTGTPVKKYFNWVFWGTGNKTGEFVPLMLNLPNGSYNKLASAIADTSGFDVLTMPAAFNVESTTGFLVSRITMSLSAGVFAIESIVDLRGSTPQSVVGGGVGGAQTEFADNQFKVFDDSDATKLMIFQLSGITTGNTRTITMADQDIDLTPASGTYPSSSAVLLKDGSVALTAPWAANNDITGVTLLRVDDVEINGNVIRAVGSGTDLAIAAGTGASNLVFSAAGGITQFNSTRVKIVPAANTDAFVDFVGTSNTGVLTYMEDEDEFRFDALVQATQLKSTGTLQVDGVATITGIADGGLTNYDLKVGDTTTPDYGMIQFGNAVIGRTSYNVGAIDLDGAIMVRNIGGPVTSEIEFIWTESAGNTCRFALPKSAVGNATYNSRSMLLAGPAPADTDFVKVSYWQGQGIFDNLVCDTAGDGADLGVQNDLEVEGDIFVDSILESTTAAGVTIDSVLLKDGLVDGRDVATDGAVLDTAMQDLVDDTTPTLGGNLDVSTNYLDWGEIGAPANPAANVARMYCKDDGGTTKLFFRDSAGAETEMGGGGGAGDVTAAANMGDHEIVRGDGGAKGVQDSPGVTIDDSANLAGLNSLALSDNKEFIFGAGPDAKLLWDTSGARDHLVLGMLSGGANSGFFSIMQLADIGDANRVPTVTTNYPRLRIFSEDATQAGDYIELFHNAVNPVIAWDNGNLQLLGGDVNIPGSLDIGGNTVHAGYFDVDEMSAPANPAANVARMYCKDDGGTTKLFFRDSAGAETEMGGTGGATHAILDGSTHNDSVAQGVTRGSIIYGNATPKWDELVKGSDNQYLACNATDVLWQGLDIVDDTTPQLGGNLDANDKIIYGSAASGGDLDLRSTSHATKGKLLLGASGNYVFDEVNGRLGLGTASPAVGLHIEDAGTAQNNIDMMQIVNTVTSADLYDPGPPIVRTDTSILWRQAHSGGTVVDMGRIGFAPSADWTSTGSTQDGEFFVSAVDGGVMTQRLTVTGDSLGFGGVTMHDTKLWLYKNGANAFFNVICASDDDTENARAVLRKAGGTFASPTAVVDGERIGQFEWRGHDGTSYQHRASLFVDVDGVVNDGTNTVPMAMSFRTGTSASPVDRLIIDSSGDILIATAGAELQFESGNEHITGSGGMLTYSARTGVGHRFKVNSLAVAEIDSNEIRLMDGANERGSLGWGTTAVSLFNGVSQRLQILAATQSFLGGLLVSASALGAPATSAILELASTTGALLVPRMTTTQKNALTPVDGMIMFDVTTSQFNFREGGAWVTGSGLA